jgi:hypothetical protein
METARRPTGHPANKAASGGSRVVSKAGNMQTNSSAVRAPLMETEANSDGRYRQSEWPAAPSSIARQTRSTPLFLLAQMRLMHMQRKASRALACKAPNTRQQSHHASLPLHAAHGSRQ